MAMVGQRGYGRSAWLWWVSVAMVGQRGYGGSAWLWWVSMAVYLKVVSVRMHTESSNLDKPG